jgi:hypothetical protein
MYIAGTERVLKYCPILAWQVIEAPVKDEEFREHITGADCRVLPVTLNGATLYRLLQDPAGVFYDEANGVALNGVEEALQQIEGNAQEARQRIRKRAGRS